MSSTVVFITGVGKGLNNLINHVTGILWLTCPYHAGIGATLARTYLARPNHTVIGSIRDESTAGVAELKSFAAADNTKLLLVHIDSASVEDPKKALAKVQKAGIDHIDVVIANAGGYPTPAHIDSVGRDELMVCFETNAAAPMLLFQTLKPLLQKASSPKWIVISTSAGSIGYVGVIGSHILTAYGASKAALNWLTQ